MRSWLGAVLWVALSIALTMPRTAAPGWGELTEPERVRIGERLAHLPVAFEIETAAGRVGMVHADFPSDDWLDLALIDWRGLRQIDSAAGDCLWSVERYARRYRGEVKNVRAVVHGHMTIPVMETLGNVYYIDTGGWKPGGHFTFLNPATLEAVVGPGSPLRAGASKRYR